jgi:hypothetical protein
MIFIIAEDRNEFFEACGLYQPGHAPSALAHVLPDHVQIASLPYRNKFAIKKHLSKAPK